MKIKRADRGRGNILQNILGVDIGGTKCAVISGNAYDDGINIINKISFPTEVNKGPDYSIENIFKNIDIILKNSRINIRDINGIGISCGGPLDSKKGIIMSPPNLYGWDNVRIVEIFEERLGVKTMLQNDANACALAEWKYGAAKGFENIVFITFGTGFGAGMILNGRLYTGASDMAGEIGHIRIDENGPVGYGKSGSLEGFCSGGGIAQLARTMILEKLQMGEKVSLCKDLSKLNKIDAKTVAYAAGKGDMLAMDIYRKSGYYLGKGLSIIIDMLNPEIIVIGSIFARSVELLWPEAEEVINRECLKLTRDTCKIVPAGLGDEIGDYASLATALYRA
jgi:glucokinase